MKMSIMDYFTNEGFINVDTPIITQNDCEGGGDAFLVQVSILFYYWMIDVLYLRKCVQISEFDALKKISIKVYNINNINIII